MKKVVLCIPIHNAVLTLAETLDTLLAQDYPIHKINLFNNASTDATAGIIGKYKSLHSNIEVHTNDVLVSAEDNFTRCISASEGDYTAIVHSDDLYEKNFISEAVKVFELNDECVAVFCHAREVDMKGVVMGERFLPPFLKKQKLNFMSYRELLQHSLNYANFITCPSAIVRSYVYKDIICTWNGRDFRTSADLDVWLRISKIGLVCFNSSPLMRYRVGSTSFSFRLAKVRVKRHELFLVLEKYLHESLDWLPESSLDDYRFLNMKDEAFRIINSYKNKADFKLLGPLPPVDLGLVIKRLFRSKWHFKISGGILLSRILLLTKRNHG
ncbi:MAG TPA: glycosyltransferase family 2 protein [Bacteriovoracaceae bacterium]|nr:glycosyltransferase family 2 protein [Bacteriovoracaceae bacterium]